MPQDMTKKWQTEDQPHVSERIKGAITPPEPLRQRLELAKRKLTEEIQALDRISGRMQEKDKNLYHQIVKAYENHDTQKAQLVSTELVELRKVESKTQYGKYALERAYAKIDMAKDFGDIAAALAPVNQIVKNVRGTLMEFLPASSNALGELNNLMSDTMVSFSHLLGDTSVLSPSSEEADNILKEAAAIAESRLKDKIPQAEDLGSGLKE
jgi:division protein CdvB (Snf7/Vps24/ESCRT-III family)